MPENTNTARNDYSSQSDDLMDRGRSAINDVSETVSDYAARLNVQNNWKRALMFGSFAAAALLLATGRRPAGFALAGVGLATLAAEYPEKFEEIWNRAPEYLDKGQRLVGGVSRIVDQIAEQAGKFQNRSNRGMREDYLT
jgi:hypothetical protein